MRFIISGSRGLIGEKLKERLDKEGNEMILEIDERCGSNVLNINSIQLTPSTQHTDIFFHLGAFCKINQTIEHPRLAHMNNANGTYEALEFCRKNNIKKFVYFSSSRILSKERNPYVASKVYGEELCKAYYDCYGIEYIIVRPSTVYGEHHDLTTRLITIWTIRALKGEDLELYGDKNKTLDFTHVDDFVDGIMLLLKNWNEAKLDAYDICGDDQRKLTEVADILASECGNDTLTISYCAPETAQPQDVKIDISKMRKFGYDPKIKIEEGVKRLVNFYKGEGAKWVK